ncbi:hypothetical protein FA13DRAFT_1776511 [Coprinellus micaceus]|uniref:Uncharacterized protein n=1 Tax=Coprinellus micaceus TaxID=71717 RepID=A0A4Y7SZH2_COPMI|nr:hypothetical protein FA13DRAFT_1776511 [Coprinellus micaceus]
MLEIKYDYRLRPIKQDLPDMREGDAATRGLDAYGRPLRCTSEAFRYTDPNSAYSSLTIDEILDPEMHRLLARWLGGLEPSEIGKHHDSIVLCINWPGYADEPEIEIPVGGMNRCTFVRAISQAFQKFYEDNKDKAVISNDPDHLEYVLEERFGWEAIHLLGIHHVCLNKWQADLAYLPFGAV